jgi:uncharacterized protein with von Willebrand factor type A (vWA) domain
MERSQKKTKDEDSYYDYEEVNQQSKGYYSGYNRYNRYDDDYNDYGYGYKRSQSQIGFKQRGQYSWSWGNFGNFRMVEDDDDELIISGSEGYLTPTSSNIRNIVGWEKASQKEAVEIIKNLSRYFYHQLFEETDIYSEHYKDRDSLVDDDLNKRMKYENIIESLKDKEVPGFTPLDKAISIFESMIQKRGDKEEKNKSLLDELDDAIYELEFDMEVINDPDYNNLIDLKEFTKKFKSQILNKISLIKNLGSKFKIDKEIEEKIVHNSDIHAIKRMTEISQLMQAPLYQRLMPNYRQKLALKDLSVILPVDRTEHKQKIIFLLDYSGSMSYELKQQWVCAFLIERFKHVIAGNAEIFFSYFVYSTDQLHFTHIHDKESVEKFWLGFSTTPNGGVTHLGDMVNHINNQIRMGRLQNLDIDLRKEKVEILAMNDGQDSVKTQNFTYKTNAITLLDQENQELKDLCLKNKGKYIFIDNNNKLHEYEKIDS